MSLGLALRLVVGTLAMDAPTRERPTFVVTAGTRTQPGDSAESSQSLLEARRLSEQLRYEEAIVEYQRYLGDGSRPARERAGAMLELGFIHLVLGDEATAQRRTLEALELDPALSLPPSAPAKQVALLEGARAMLAAQIRIEVLPRTQTDAPQELRAHLTDPQKRVKRALLRHSLSPRGPFYSTELRCLQSTCVGTLPPPEGVANFNAFYYLEALDAEGATLAQAGSPTAPSQLSVVGRGSWYKSPWVWGASGAALVAIAGVVYLLSPPPPK